MNPYKPKKIEWISLYVLLPLLLASLLHLLFGERFNDMEVWLKACPVIVACMFLSWYLHIVTMNLLRIRLPGFKQTLLRLSCQAFIHLSVITACMVFFFYGFAAMHFLGYTLNVHNFRMAVVMGIVVVMIATTIWEGDYIFIKFRESLAEKELIGQLQLQNEFESLKSQVNPHFLFNCFNTLSSLINENTDSAEQFLNEMSKVYRYLLRNNEDGLTTLNSELQFIRSYFALLKSRYGDGVELQIDTDKRYENYLLPSLSLQLLVENAVKHNIISKQFPLVIDIFTTAGNKLIVNNNLQLKMIKAPSNKIGLQNIRLKYNILEQQGFQVLADDKNFTVVLPLLWSKTTEHKHTLTLKPSQK